MRIAVYGAGGVGGYFGGRLAMLPCHEVFFIARGTHLTAMKAEGLTVTTGMSKESFTVSPCNATDKPEEIGEVDVLLVCVKAWQVPEAAEAIKRSGMIGPETVVVPLQNGLESVATLKESLGEERVCGGLCKIYGFIEGPGRVICPSGGQSVEFGCLGGASPRADHPHVVALRDAFVASGVDVILHEDVKPAMWMKYIFICVLSGIGSVTRVSWGEARSIPQTWSVCEQCVREAVAVARAAGVDIDEEGVDKQLQFFASGLPSEVTASMQRDIMEEKPSELEAQIGAMVRFAKSWGVAAPAFNMIYATLLPLEHRARGTAVSFPSSAAHPVVARVPS